MYRPLAVIRLDLAQPLPELGGLERFGAVRVLAALGSDLLGYADAPVRDGRCSPAALGDALHSSIDPRRVRVALAARLLNRTPAAAPAGLPGLLAPRESPAPAPLPSVSVAVCTRDRPQALEACLGSLDSLAPRPIEVLVVDNAPESDAAERLARCRFPEVRYLREHRPGLNWARNRALAEAKGDIIAFTDDDVLADSSWCGALASLFGSAPEAAAVTGFVAPAALDTPAQLLFERYGGFGQGFSRSWHRVDTARGELVARRYGATGIFGTGANMAFRRHVLLGIGGFDPALDVGTATRGGGDLEIFFRIIKHGHFLVREPRALVWHRHREGYSELHDQISTWGMGMYAYVLRSCRAYPAEIPGFIWTAFQNLGLRTARRLLRALGRGDIPAALVLAEAKTSLLAPSRLRRARRDADRIRQQFGPLSLATGEPVYGVPAEHASVPGSAEGSPRMTRPVVRQVDVAEALEPLDLPGSARTIRIEVLCTGQPCGTFVLNTLGAAVSVPRLSDAIARALPGELLRAAGLHAAAGADPLRALLAAAALRQPHAGLAR